MNKTRVIINFVIYYKTSKCQQNVYLLDMYTMDVIVKILVDGLIMRTTWR